MSIWATDWAWRQGSSTGEKLILLALAAFADKDGVCYPGQAKLAAMSGMTSRTVRTHLATLEAREVIKRTSRWREDGTRNTDIYQLVGPAEEFAGSGGVKRKVLSRQAENFSTVQRKIFPGNTSEENPSENTEEPYVRPKPDAQVQSTDSERLKPQDLADAWNEHCAPIGLSRVAEISATRRKKLLLRLHEHPKIDFWSDVFTRIRGSPFLRGLRSGNGNGNKHENWRASFDWLIENDTNAVKIVEGKYDEQGPRQGR